MAEMDLLQLQAFADKLAGVVLDQVEADQALDREKISSAMMGHVVKFALEQRKTHVAELQKALDGVEMSAGMGAVIYGDKPSSPAPSRDYVITGRPSNGNPVHVICRCDECLRRRKLSLCGCEMCQHHSEAAAIGQAREIAERQGIRDESRARLAQRRMAWDVGAEWLQKQAERKGFRAAYLQDVETVTVQLYRLDELGQRQALEATPDSARYLGLAIRGDRPVEVINGDAWFFPDGLVMTGLDLARAGRSAAQIWDECRRLNRNPRP